ncbi:hypothetical protein [Burkholderia cenocepacia]|uniref:hypothetical protein n=1 Tax=Burkholderia cenocepacia TaxID=95486 RepID=UPI000F59D38D|nr:hypothetical protein [Burkholderia cenocepacia]
MKFYAGFVSWVAYGLLISGIAGPIDDGIGLRLAEAKTVCSGFDNSCYGNGVGTSYHEVRRKEMTREELQKSLGGEAKYNEYVAHSRAHNKCKTDAECERYIGTDIASRMVGGGWGF